MLQLASLSFLSFRIFYLQLHPALGMEENGNGHENMESSSPSNSLTSDERYTDLRKIYIFKLKLYYPSWAYHYIAKRFHASYVLDQCQLSPQRAMILSRTEEYLLFKQTTTLLSICCHFSYLSNLHLYWVSKICIMHDKSIYMQYDHLWISVHPYLLKLHLLSF